MTDFNLPDTLIKYYPCNYNSLDAISNSYLWASHPLQFNDPFDCSEKFWLLESFTYESILKVVLDEKIQKKFSPKDSNFEIRKLFVELFVPGIICLNEPSGEREDILWGYYTNHEGFRVDFNSQKLRQDLGNPYPVKVIYDEDLNSVEKCSLNKDNMKNWVTFKKRLWNNEQEWRFVIDGDDCNRYNPLFKMGDISVRKRMFTLKSVSSITLGYRFFFEQIHSQRKTQKTDHIFEYHFRPEDNCNRLYLLSFIYEKGIDLFQMDISESFKLGRRPIQILKVDGSKILIYDPNHGHF